ncbi:4-diphosphocytidyl-2-C-methyl-D-erythritol kinase [Sediminihabitans luteus]|uniref:4-diphosphocytidyl-2-C-methyl-D-erythritol kinase n=1 Tax=Sediminihabitans luteus TaxID=1138585 RepID=A0A2M9CDB5_9CELL|nr:4-(cytidine 5'-diphospho)-2-C-methyl-D-erythritol kinase [Sediminihabitans luteus]PJJ69852.1 4-diphosphocytidyl-2-C-methyl-D-erythritol kinase [Sediminihabitans luteus]GIJ00637.1 4-diphosphocytidyl-2-C-methyl-D-erythritol kinase [Sediminihabitans luteus]
MSRLVPVPRPSVRVRAPGKVNLALCVGAPREDGYHPLVTIFQAVSLVEDLELTTTPEGSGISLAVSGLHAEAVPTDATNLAWRAVELVAARLGVEPDVRIDIVKGVPVGGGMAGGSADAAAALVAADHLWDGGLPRDELHGLAAELGSDVPFGLLGHTAVGTGRGHLLTPAMTRGDLHWAFATRTRGLSTPAVFRAFDEHVGGPDELAPDDVAPLMAALRRGDAVAVGAALRNDLQAASLALAPELAETIEVAEGAGSLGAIVSGSGPTVAALARSRQHALAICAAWTAAGVADDVHTATGPVAGARVVTAV